MRASVEGELGSSDFRSGVGANGGCRKRTRKDPATSRGSTSPGRRPEEGCVSEVRRCGISTLADPARATAVGSPPVSPASVPGARSSPVSVQAKVVVAGIGLVSSSGRKVHPEEEPVARARELRALEREERMDFEEEIRASGAQRPAARREDENERRGRARLDPDAHLRRSGDRPRLARQGLAGRREPRGGRERFGSAGSPGERTRGRA